MRLDVTEATKCQLDYVSGKLTERSVAEVPRQLLRRQPTPRASAVHDGITTPALDIIDARLKAKAVARDVVLVVPALSVLPFVLQGTDRIATVPEQAAKALAGDYDTVCTSSLPFKSPKFDISMAWRSRTDRGPAEQLLPRRVIVEEMKCRLKAPVDGE